MSEINVGEYIRPFDEIEKVTSIDNDFFIRTDKCNIYYPSIVEITKHSPNIIDLIEEGDYVNGHKIFKFKIETNNYGYKYLSFYDLDRECAIFEREIKSIVTKERFKESEYKV